MMIDYFNDILDGLKDSTTICRFIKVILDDLSSTNFPEKQREMNKKQNRQILTELENENQQLLIDKLKEIEVENQTKMELKTQLDKSEEKNQGLESQINELKVQLDRFNIQ